MPATQSTLLTTKLFVARPQGPLVTRGGLTDRLDEIALRRLTLVSAPAGFGKTTALGRWIEERNYPTAWLQLDADDNTLGQFLAYLVAAVQTLHPAVGEAVSKSLEHAQPTSAEALITILINDLAAISDGWLLVLDDYHLIENPAIHEGVSFLLDHAPPTLHLAIITRADPPIPVARLRVRGGLLELRAADLRFSGEEASLFFNDLLGLKLTEEHLGALQEKTEGWAAGLQMAGLSLQGRDDVAGFIDAFTGEDRFVLDYLLEEALALLPDDLVRRLLEISIADRFNAELCEAITEADSGAALLAELERRNLFLVPLDNNRTWYRYHHLFSELLRHRLATLQPDGMPELHRRASLWHSSRGMLSEAIAHARLSGDRVFVRELINGNWRRILGRAHQDVIAALAAMFTPETASAAVGVLTGWDLAYRADTRGLVESIDWIKGLVEKAVTDPEYTEMLGYVELLQAISARDRGAPAEIIAHATRAMQMIPEYSADSPEYSWLASHGLMQSLVGDAYHVLGEVGHSIAAFERSLAMGRSAQDMRNVFIALTNLCRENVKLGRLREALRRSDELMEVVASSGGILTPTALIYQLRAQVHYERLELHEARENAARAIERSSPQRHGQEVESRRIMAMIEIAENNIEAALEQIHAMELIPIPSASGRFRAVAPQLRARIALIQGDIQSAVQWSEYYVEGNNHNIPERAYGAQKREDLFYASVLIAQNRLDEADKFLTSLCDELHKHRYVVNEIEALALRAMLAQRRGDGNGAMDFAESALSLGVGENIIRSFAMQGDAMARIIVHISRRRYQRGRGISISYLNTILKACGVTPITNDDTDLPPITAGFVSRDKPQLTSRELEILQLMSNGYSNQKIADKLYVSINTIKTHISNLFDKLDAKSRVEALFRAREEELIE